MKCLTKYLSYFALLVMLQRYNTLDLSVLFITKQSQFDEIINNKI